VFAHFRPILNDDGITEQQWRIVRALLESGPLEPREIGALCHLSSPNLAGVLARMDDLGLVARERMADDARRVKVSITAKSRPLAARMAPRIEATYRKLEAKIGPDAAERLYATLDELIAVLDAGGAGEAGEEDR
jgi:homoprotocatechuate degradation regulator HpaR